MSLAIDPAAQGPSSSKAGPLVWRFADAEFDETRFELRVAGEMRALEAKPLAILHQLLRRGGELVTKAELLLAVWPGVATVEQSLTTAISKLRAALDDREWSVVRAVRGQGYRIGVPVLARAAAEPPAALLAAAAGERVRLRPQWVFERRLQAGPGGAVWLCRHASLDERRVFKFATTAARREALRREAAISRLLREALGERPDFVPVLDCNLDAAPFHLESAYAGPDLATWAASREGLGAVPLAERVAIVARIARTLAAAHDIGVLHRDVKPANVLVGAGGAARLVDFGSGHVVDAARFASMTQTASENAAAFTFRYAAPEVLAGGSATVLSDVYALGVLLFQMVAGDFERPLAIGWEDAVADPLLRADIAEAASGDPDRRLPASAALADRLERLPARREEVLRRAEEADTRARLAAFADIQARAAEAARLRAAHATALARRTRIGAFGAVVLAAVAIGFWADALHADRLAHAQADRAERASGAGWTAVAGLTDAILNDVLDRQVPIDLKRRLLEHAERVVGEMSHAVPDNERVQRLGAGAMIGFANLAFHQGDFPRAIAIGRRAAAMMQALLARQPHERKVLVELSQCERWIGDGALAEGDYATATSAYEADRQALVAVDAPAGDADRAKRIAWAEEAIGDVELRQGRNAAALATYRQAMATLHTVPPSARVETEWQMSLSVAEEKIGDALDAAGRSVEARATYADDLAIRRRMLALDPMNTRYQRNVGNALQNVGEETTKLGDGHGAMPGLLEAAAIYSRLAASDAANFMYKTDIADVTHDVGLAEAQAGDVGAARTSFQRAIDETELLLARSPDDAELRRALATMEVDAKKVEALPQTPQVQAVPDLPK